MQDPLVSLEEFERRVPGGVAQGDSDRALARLQDASALVRSVAGSVADDWSESGSTVPDIIQMITIAAAMRAFVKPEMVASETIVAFTGSFTSGPSSVFLTKSETQAIRRVSGQDGVWTLSTTRTDTDADGNQILDVPTPVDAFWPQGQADDDPIRWEP